MKDTLILQDKIYISARRVHELFGYTSDYVGQLCRAGKLEAKMIGRSWFVTEQSVLDYKKTIVGIIAETREEKSIIGKAILEKKEIPVKKVTPVVVENVAPTIAPPISLPKTPHVTITYTPSFSPQVRTSTPIISKVPTATLPAYVSGLKLAVASICCALILGAYAYVTVTPKNAVVASLGSVSEQIVEVITEKLSSLSKTFAGLFYKTSSRAPLVVEDTQKKIPAYNGMAVAPSTQSLEGDEALKERIRNSFSDEVRVTPDEDGTSGVITPVFKKVEGDDFVYVLVPVDSGP